MIDNKSLTNNFQVLKIELLSSRGQKKIWSYNFKNQSSGYAYNLMNLDEVGFKTKSITK